MRIVHLIQRPQLRGAEVFAAQIGKIHWDQGHEVLFIALFPNTIRSKRLSVEGPPLVLLNAKEKFRFFDIPGYRTLANQLSAFRPDIVQANAGDTLKYAALSRKFFGFPGKLVYRNANKTSEFINSEWKRKFNRWLSFQVDYVASVSRNCEMDFQQTFSYPANKTTTLTIGTPIPDHLADREQVRAELNLPPEEPIIINIGSFVPEKNHLGLIDIFNQVHRRLSGGQLVLIGDGLLRPDIERKIENLGLSKRVHLLGYRSDAVYILQAADLMVMPSFIEGMPGVILEAMAHHIPVIASDTGGINEIIDDNRTGILAKPQQPESFIAPAVDLIRHPECRKEIADAAFHYCKASKAIEVIARDFMGFYKRIVTGESGKMAVR